MEATYILYLGRHTLETALLVASLPVPAVVGIAIKGSFLPLGGWVPTPSRKRVVSPCSTNMAEMAFPPSRALPPPTPMIKSVLAYKGLATISSIIAGDGSAPIWTV